MVCRFLVLGGGCLPGPFVVRGLSLGSSGFLGPASVCPLAFPFSSSSSAACRVSPRGTGISGVLVAWGSLRCGVTFRLCSVRPGRVASVRGVPRGSVPVGLPVLALFRRSSVPGSPFVGDRCRSSFVFVFGGVLCFVLCFGGFVRWWPAFAVCVPFVWGPALRARGAVPAPVARGRVRGTLGRLRPGRRCCRFGGGWVGGFRFWRCAVSLSRVLVGFCGSRDLPSRASDAGLVAALVASVLAAGRAVAVGCCVGADAVVLRAFLRSSRGLVSRTSGSASLALFAAFGPSGAGSWRGSALPLVLRAARVSPGHGCVSPVSVRWWAGGASSVSLVGRLRARSRALVSAVSSSGPGAGLVALVSGGPGESRGSWGTLAAAADAGLPVVVFPCAPRELLSCPPGWVPSPAQWVSAVPSRFPARFSSLGPVSWVPAAPSGVWAAGFVPVPR